MVALHLEKNWMQCPLGCCYLWENMTSPNGFPSNVIKCPIGCPYVWENMKENPSSAEYVMWCPIGFRYMRGDMLKCLNAYPSNRKTNNIMMFLFQWWKRDAVAYRLPYMWENEMKCHIGGPALFIIIIILLFSPLPLRQPLSYVYSCYNTSNNKNERVSWTFPKIHIITFLLAHKKYKWKRKGIWSKRHSIKHAEAEISIKWKSSACILFSHDCKSIKHCL